MQAGKRRLRIPRSIRTKVLLRCEGKCEKCGEKLGDLVPDVHHKDGNPKNNDLSNLIVLCPNCHRKEEKSPEILTSSAASVVCSFVGEGFDSERFLTNIDTLNELRDPQTRLIMIEKIRHQTTDLPLDGMPHDVKDAAICLLLILEKEIRNPKIRKLCLDILHIISGKRDSEVNDKIKELFLSWIEENLHEFSIEEKHYAMDIRQTLYKYDASFLKGLMLDSINKWSQEDFEKLYKEIEFYRLNRKCIKDLKMLLWKLRDDANKKQFNEKVQRIDKLLELYAFR